MVKVAGGEFDETNGCEDITLIARAKKRDGCEHVGLPAFEEVFVDKRARRDDPGDRSVEDTLCVARILDLIANGDAMSSSDHLRDVGLDRVVGHARHREAFGALGECHA